MEAGTDPVTGVMRVVQPFPNQSVEVAGYHPRLDGGDGLLQSVQDPAVNGPGGGRGHSRRDSGARVRPITVPAGREVSDHELTLRRGPSGLHGHRRSQGDRQRHHRLHAGTPTAGGWHRRHMITGSGRSPARIDRSDLPRLAMIAAEAEAGLFARHPHGAASSAGRLICRAASAPTLGGTFLTGVLADLDHCAGQCDIWRGSASEHPYGGCGKPSAMLLGAKGFL